MIGIRLRKLRTDNDMTQEEMADLLSVTPQAISRWENSVSVPDTNFLIPIADLFNVSVDFILREPNTSDKTSLVENIKTKLVIDVVVEKSTSGSFRVDGIIINESDYNLARIDLKIYFKDSSGKTVDYKETSESALCANGEKPLSRYSFSKKDIVNVGVEVSGVSIKES